VPVTETFDQPRPTGDRFDILDICLIATFAQILLVRLNHARFRHALVLGAAELLQGLKERGARALLFRKRDYRQERSGAQARPRVLRVW
jgi:hypothetical protein